MKTAEVLFHLLDRDSVLKLRPSPEKLQCTSSHEHRHLSFVSDAVMILILTRGNLVGIVHTMILILHFGGSKQGPSVEDNAV